MYILKSQRIRQGFLNRTSREFACSEEKQWSQSLASYFKGLYEVSLCKGSDKDVATALGIKEYSAKKNREQAMKFGKGELLSLYNAVYQAISDIKCGGLTPSSALKAITATMFFRKN
jgi:hypothetical protein